MDRRRSSHAGQPTGMGAPHGTYSRGADSFPPDTPRGSAAPRASRDEEQALLWDQGQALVEEQPAQRTQGGALQVLITVSLSVAFMLVSTALIVANKHIVKDLDFRYPMLVGSMGMFTSSMGAFIACNVLHVADSQVSVSPEFYLKHMVPVGVVMAVTVWSGNLVYLFLTVSFTQMLKAAGPIFIMIAMFLARLESPTLPLIASVLTITGGLVVASHGEIHFNWVGVGVMMVSEVGEATRLVMTQILLRDLHMGPFDGLLYLAPACFWSLLVAASWHEIPDLLASGRLQVVTDNLSLFCVAALFGFATNLLGYALIKVTGSLTLKVLCVVRNVLVISIGMLAYGDPHSSLQAAGYTISLAGFCYYTYAKAQQGPANK